MNLKTLESLRLKFCKMVLKLKRSTPDIMVYGETGRFQIEYYAKKRIINFWNRVTSGSTDKCSYKMYMLSKQLHDSGSRTSTWYLNLVRTLESYGITNVPVESENIKAVVKNLHMSLKSEYISKWKGEVEESRKCGSLYKHIKTIFEFEYYLNNLPHNLRLAMARIRTSNHRLPIETGRYRQNRVPRDERVCTKCDSGLVGDEYHFILVCSNPILKALREKYIAPFYRFNPNMDKLKELFCNRGRKLFKLARFVEEGLKLY